MKKTAPLLVLSVILLLFANLGLWLSSTIYNQQKFTEIAVSVYEQPDVRNAIAGEIVDDALQSRPIVRQTIGEQIQAGVAGILGSQASKKVFERAAARYQNYLTTDNREDVTIEIGQTAAFVKSVATAVSPDLGAQVPDVTPKTITIIRSDSLPDVNRWLQPIMWLSPIAGLAGIIILIYLVYESKDKSSVLMKIGGYFVVGIALFALLIPYVRSIIQGNVNDQTMELITTKTYDAFVAVLANQLLILAIIFSVTFLIGYFLRVNSNRPAGSSPLIIHRKEESKNGDGVSKK